MRVCEQRRVIGGADAFAIGAIVRLLVVAVVPFSSSFPAHIYCSSHSIVVS